MPRFSGVAHAVSSLAGLPVAGKRQTGLSKGKKGDRRSITPNPGDGQALFVAFCGETGVETDFSRESVEASSNPSRSGGRSGRERGDCFVALAMTRQAVGLAHRTSSDACAPAGRYNKWFGCLHYHVSLSTRTRSRCGIAAAKSSESFWMVGTDRPCS
ncbi:protein of unknown function [Candidatus Methylomirabilis oxygeniifera]|uniref:Uncharacterized protein n=1 Tax=Methylomirabilis oxygeniifera TaxID=671143 RepID=D5MF81_METO1|nr:protein of unknown function [Candidatus Methylomirabilis oxyfera]